MPINKPAAISAALLLAISSIAQAETDFDFNQIPADERQRFFFKKQLTKSTKNCPILAKMVQSLSIKSLLETTNLSMILR